MNIWRRATCVVEFTVEAKFSNSLLKVNRHGTRTVKVFVDYYESTKRETASRVEGKCHLMKKQKGINWDFPEECPAAVARVVVNMFTYQEVVDYINMLEQAGYTESLE